MSNSLKTNIKKVAFTVAKNTLFKGMPDHFKNGFERAMNGTKTAELPFMHFQVDDLVLPAMVNEEQLDFYSTFKTRCEDIFLVTYPKAGTVWLTEIVRQINLSTGNGDPFGKFGFLFEGYSHEYAESLKSPRYMVTHLPLSLTPYDPEVKYIYLARNPRDLAVSYFHFMKWLPIFEFEGTWDQFLKYFMAGNLPWGCYFDHVLDWWAQKDYHNVIFVKYEDLKKDLAGQVKVIAQFLGFQFSDQQAQAVAEKCTFEAMKANPNQQMQKMQKLNQLFKKGSHLRKGVVGDWQNYFSESQLEQFNQLYQSRMQGTGLDFEFQSAKI